MTDTFQSRTELLLGTDGVERLRRAHVLVVGLGGVGGYAAEMLCRAGVGHLTIVDGDTVSRSNCNRQLIALQSTVGESKAVLFERRFREINPDCEVTAINTFLRDEAMISLLEKGNIEQSSEQAVGQTFDYIVDAIDTLSPKVYLLYHAHKLGIPVVSAMGSAGKLDPSKIQVADISKSNTCPLAAMVRKKLHRLGVSEGFKVVFSIEKVAETAVVEEPSQNKRTTVGVVSYMPAMFGCYCASTVIMDLTNKSNSNQI